MPVAAISAAQNIAVIMSAKPSKSKETHYNRTEQPADGAGGGKEKSNSRQRKDLSPERAKDQAKRTFKDRSTEGDKPYRKTTRTTDDSRERPERKRREEGSEDRPYERKTSRPSSDGGGSRDFSDGKRPARRTDDSRERPVRKQREEGSEGRPYERKTSRPSSDRGGSRDFSDGKRPARRTDDNRERPERKRRDDDGTQRSYERKSDSRSFDRKERNDFSEDRRPGRPRKTEDGDSRSFDKKERKPYQRSEERPGRDNNDRRGGGRGEAGDKPFKKYVPFEDRKDKSTRPEGRGEKRFDPKSRDEKPFSKGRSGKFEDKKGEQPEDRRRSRKYFEDQDFYEDERPFTRSTKWDEQAKAGPMTLNKYLAHSGISSRREAASIVKEGKIKVNGVVMTEPGYRVNESDKITYDDKEMKLQKHHVYILLNKPKDFITTTDDEKGRKKVMDLVANAGVERLYPVGRLDRNTTGVLLITNDGDLAQKLSHPSYNSKKIYQVTLDRNLTKRDFDKIIEGVKLEDGVAPVDALAYLEKKNELGIEIHSGRNRIVRRIFEGLGYTVEKLDRVVYAGLTKKNVSRGKWRFLTEKEIIRLKHFKS